MNYVVAKPFKTANRRFSPGMPIAPAEVLGDVTFEVWCERGFIAEAAPVEAEAEADSPPARSRRAR